MTEYALSRFELDQSLSTGDMPLKLSLGRRLLLWIETNQQRKADREISRTCSRLGIKPERRLAGR